MSRRSFTNEHILALLHAGPRRIAALTADVLPEQLQRRPAPDEWSANEILAHLRACADQWGDCIAAILASDRPTLRAINPRSWVRQTNYPALPFADSFQAYALQRDVLLVVLKELPPEGWTRTAIVTGAGAQLERSVHFYAQWLAGHERTHFKQIARSIRSG